MPVQRLAMGGGQPHERLLVAGLGGREYGVIEGGCFQSDTQALAGGTGGGPPSSVHGDGS